MPTALQLCDVSRAFGRVRALSGVSLEIESGSAAAVLGPNGAGKTTLLKICSTLLQPTAGSVLVDGLDAKQNGAEVRRHLAVLGHDSQLYTDLTALENLQFAARLRGAATSGDELVDILHRVGLRPAARRPVGTFSRGMQQRCAIARLLVQQPNLLLLDEPATGLDLAARETLHDIVRGLRKTGTTVLLTTHDLGEAATLCEQALVIAAGKLHWQGPMNDQATAELRAVTGATEH